MFYTVQNDDSKDTYIKFLRTVGSLSNLFSDSEIPYLYYRVAEKIFCRAFDAEDLSRSDVSADAKKSNTGIGLKTFLMKNNNTFQKVAEFNSDRPLYIGLPDEGLIRKVSELRNARIGFTENLHNLDSSIYHCVIRDAGKFKIFEESMDYIDIENIKINKKNKNSIVFNDGINEYSFLLSKSTLTKRFATTEIVDEFEVEVFSDPLVELQSLFLESTHLEKASQRIKDTIYLPLYGSKQTVYDKSGLNQWNANGRKRDIDEVYIPVPTVIHKKFPSFFPERGVPFHLILPSGESLTSKICQSGGKALMSCKNKELGNWILRQVLKLKEGEILTYSKLQEIGIDSVRIDKIADGTFEINFNKINSYENFIVNKP